MRGMLLLAGLLLSCGPDATDNPTTRCETDRACAADSFCYRGFCVADGVSHEPAADAPAPTQEWTANASEVDAGRSAREQNTDAPMDASSAAPAPMPADDPAKPATAPAKPAAGPAAPPPEMQQAAASPDASAHAEPTCSDKKCCAAAADPAQEEQRAKRCDCADAAPPKCDGDGAEQKK